MDEIFLVCRVKGFKNRKFIERVWIKEDLGVV